MSSRNNSNPSFLCFQIKFYYMAWHVCTHLCVMKGFSIWYLFNPNAPTYVRRKVGKGVSSGGKQFRVFNKPQKGFFKENRNYAHNILPRLVKNYFFQQFTATTLCRELKNLFTESFVFCFVKNVFSLLLSI